LLWPRLVCLDDLLAHRVIQGRAGRDLLSNEASQWTGFAGGIEAWAKARTALWACVKISCVPVDVPKPSHVDRAACPHPKPSPGLQLDGARCGPGEGEEESALFACAGVVRYVVSPEIMNVPVIAAEIMNVPVICPRKL